MDKSMLTGLESLPEADQQRMASMICTSVPNMDASSSFILVNALFSPFCNQEVLSLSDSCVGSDIYQETLAKALAKHFGARLLIVDSLSLPGGTPSKEVDSAKESSKPERPSVLAKRSTHAASLKHSKPASSVDAEIVGGSTISSQAMLKQEVSTASSKGTTIKTGDRVKFVGNFPSAVSSIQNHPSRVMLLGGRAPEYLAHDPLVALVIKLFSSGKALASICLGQLILAAAGVAKDHKFTAFPPVKPAPVASGAHWTLATVVDGNLITAATYEGHSEFIQHFVKALAGNISGSNKKILFLCGI
ncbi:hypothetical protein Ahy_B08g091652 [Arachis hypogaea]|uniref:DJ-1/PfpI domain-containing protein n=1 Tax=Arachis hypogaea TaxID=3818 RepID=A0A444Y2I0_ARAHY|nr:hypothetical protein Ahy_B08g091652 [Arachis hypogaea]